jgi:uncharacterized BrkB/YihY/UPF0761 family membrane protein
MGTLFGGTALLAHALDLLVSFVFVTALFAMIYKVLPTFAFNGGTYGSARL